MSGTRDVIIAGGVESMSQVPIGSPAVAVKEMWSPFDGVEISKRYPGEQFSQFNGAERMAEKYGVSKEELDQFAYDSHKRGAAATEAGRFKDEIIPITVTLEDGSQEEHVVDEGIRWEADLAAIKVCSRWQRRLHQRGQCQPDHRWRVCADDRQRESPERIWPDAAGPYSRHVGSRL